jgi:hypothetical protein
VLADEQLELLEVDAVSLEAELKLAEHGLRVLADKRAHGGLLDDMPFFALIELEAGAHLVIVGHEPLEGVLDGGGVGGVEGDVVGNEKLVIHDFLELLLGVVVEQLQQAVEGDALAPAVVQRVELLQLLLAVPAPADGHALDELLPGDHAAAAPEPFVHLFPPHAVEVEIRKKVFPSDAGGGRPRRQVVENHAQDLFFDAVHEPPLLLLMIFPFEQTQTRKKLHINAIGCPPA